MLGLKLNQVSNRGSRCLIGQQYMSISTFNDFVDDIASFKMAKEILWHIKRIAAPLYKNILPPIYLLSTHSRKSAFIEAK